MGAHDPANKKIFAHEFFFNRFPRNAGTPPMTKTARHGAKPRLSV
jgi:hypothetical protein